MNKLQLGKACNVIKMAARRDIVVYRQYCPEVHRLITYYRCPWPLIATRWFICLFIDVVPTEVQKTNSVSVHA